MGVGDDEEAVEEEDDDEDEDGADEEADSSTFLSAPQLDYLTVRDDPNLLRLFESIGPPRGILPAQPERVLLSDDLLLFPRAPTRKQLAMAFGDYQAIDGDMDSPKTTTRVKTKTKTKAILQPRQPSQSRRPSSLFERLKMKHSGKATSTRSDGEDGGDEADDDAGDGLSSDSERDAHAPVRLTLVITNYAVYTFPPPIWVDEQRFLVLNSYHFFPLQEILLLSLPYETVVNEATGDDYARRLDDFVLHTRDNQRCWFKGHLTSRNEIVETVSRAFSALVGLQIDLENIDCHHLHDILQSGKIQQHIQERRMDWWASNRPLMEGELLYMYRGRVDGQRDAHDSVNWEPRWISLFADNSLLHFASQSEFEAFRYVGSSPFVASANKFPAHYFCHHIDLSKCRLRQRMTRNEHNNGDDVMFELTTRVSLHEWEYLATLRPRRRHTAAASAAGGAGAVGRRMSAPSPGSAVAALARQDSRGLMWDEDTLDSGDELDSSAAAAATADGAAGSGDESVEEVVCGFLPGPSPEAPVLVTHCFRIPAPHHLRGDRKPRPPKRTQHQEMQTFETSTAKLLRWIKALRSSMQQHV